MRLLERIALLGADPANLLRLVISRGPRLTAGGVLFGTVAALAVTRLLRQLLYNVSPHDPVVFGTRLSSDDRHCHLRLSIAGVEGKPDRSRACPARLIVPDTLCGRAIVLFLINGLHGSNALGRFKSSKDTQIICTADGYEPFGGRTNCPRYLTKTCTLLSQPYHLVAIDYATRTAQRLSLQLRIAQTCSNSLLDRRSTAKVCTISLLLARAHERY